MSKPTHVTTTLRQNSDVLRQIGAVLRRALLLGHPLVAGLARVDGVEWWIRMD